MFAMNPMHESEASKLRKDLEAAKLREAELGSQLTESQQREAVVCGKNLALMDQRDAALSALEIAQIALKNANASKPCPLYADALAACIDPSAALAERDRAIREECAAWLSRLPLPRLASDYRREFSLKLKPEGE